MPNLAQYEKNLATSGPELILEVASDDPEITDADYLKLYRAVLRCSPRQLGGTAKHWASMGDRDYARAELNKDFA